MSRTRAPSLWVIAFAACCSATRAGREDAAALSGPSVVTHTGPPESSAVSPFDAASAVAAAASAVAAAASAGAAAASAGAAPDPAQGIAATDALDVLFPSDARTAARSRCIADAGDAVDAIRCLIEQRYAAYAKERLIALALFEQSGSIVGLEREQQMDGGFRGRIQLVPELPVGRYARHLEWVAAASRDFDELFAQLARRRPADAVQPSFRWRSIAYRFFRSVGRTTPSAYALGWTVAYNVSGSLHGSVGAVRETLFHEIFHLNDAARGGWSRARIGALYDSIVARCGTKMTCLAPYAPGSTTVRGGTYYAFQPDNGDGVAEYAAELAVRWHSEHSGVLAGKPPRRPFECGPAENGRAWLAMVDEFFGGADLVPPCQ